MRALKGFTRLSPVEAGDNSAVIAPLSETKLNWLPAIEVRGEGIFINLDVAKVTQWEVRRDVVERAATAHVAAERAWKEHNGDDRPFPMTISPRLLLVHTTAHALAERLSLDSGYSTASIRERLYVSQGSGGMCGFLLYHLGARLRWNTGWFVAQGARERTRPGFHIRSARSRMVQFRSALQHRDPFSVRGLGICGLSLLHLPPRNILRVFQPASRSRNAS